MTLACRMGPALPSSLIEPPPATSASSENGKDDVAEKSRNSRLTFSSLVDLKVKRPLEILTSFTERSVGAEELAVGAGVGVAGVAVRRFASEARKIPVARGGLKQRDLRLIDRQRSNIELPRKNQRPEFHADGERPGAQERFFAERRIIRDGDITRRRAAGE